MLKLFRVLVVILFLSRIGSAGQSPYSSTSTTLGPAEDLGAVMAPAGQQNQDSPGNAVPAIPRYPNSPSGLETLMSNMVALEKGGDEAALRPYFQSLILPHPEAWFPSEFGDKNCADKQMAANDCLGSRLALTYASIARTFPSAATKMLRYMLSDSLIHFEAVDHAAQCPSPQRILPARELVGELTTTPILSPVLSKLVQNHEPVYVLWVYNETKETTVAFFVYVDGAFRYIGMPHPASVEEFFRKSSLDQAKAETAQTVDNAEPFRDLTNGVSDDKAVLADPALVERTVVLHVLIGPDGKPREVSYVRGPEAFKDAAIRTVKKKQFTPLSFGGHTVQVSTCVNIVSPR